MMQPPEKPQQNAAKIIFLCSAQKVTALVTSEKTIIKFFIRLLCVNEHKTELEAEKKHIHAHIEIITDDESVMLSLIITEKGF